jgi:3-oxoacyl-[acyl-carrier protein] reductase
LTDDLSLDGRVALVSGGTRGIGRAVAETLARHGASIVVTGASEDPGAAALATSLQEAHGVEALGVACDVRQPQRVRSLYGDVFKAFGRLDVLVNNAGILRDALIGMVSDDVLEETFRVNTLGAIHHLQSAARLIQRSGRGSIVNITSIIGVEGNEGQIAYSSSKAALIGLTRSAAKELAPRGVRVNAVAPGFIDTDMSRSLPPDKFDERLASVKMGRIGTPQDVANVVLFLASDLSDYVTGQVIGVDGGMVV